MAFTLYLAQQCSSTTTYAMCSLRMSVINVQNSIYFVKIRNKFRSFHICQKFISEKMKQQLYLGHQWFGIPVLFCCYAVLAQVTCFCEIKNPFWPMRKKNKWREGWCDGTGHCVQCVILNENVQFFFGIFLNLLFRVYEKSALLIKKHNKVSIIPQFLCHN